MYRTIAFCCLLWLAGAASAPAQEAPADTIPGSAPAESEAALPDTLISGESVVTIPEPGPYIRGIPILGSRQFVSRRSILELASGSLAEAIFLIPGVHVTRTGWHGLPQMLNLRGMKPDAAVCLLDGMPFYDGRTEALDLNWVPLVGIDTCRVAKGGLSSLHGSGAAGGVLGIRSRTSMPEFPESEIGAWWGDFDSRELSLLFSRRITRRLGILATYENLETGGWIEDSSADSDRFLTKATVAVGAATRIDVIGYTYRGGFDRPDSCPDDPSTYHARLKDKRNLLGASLVTGERRRLHFRCYRLETSEAYSSAVTRWVEEGLLQGGEIDLSWLDADSAETNVGAGVKSRRFVSDSLGKHISTDYHMHAFKERKWNRYVLQGRIRLAKNSASGAELGGELAVGFAPREGVTLFSRLDRSYRFPGFHALYHRGRGRPADPRIGTESSLGLEVGAVASGGPLTASVSLFGRDASGFALRLLDDSCGTYFDPDVDIGFVGAEVSIAVSMQTWLETEISYSAIRVRDGAGVRPAYVPPYTVAVLARLRKALSRHISAGITFAGRYEPPTELGSRLDPCALGGTCLAGAELPGHLSALLTAFIDIDRVTVYLRVQNLTDETIRAAWGRPGLPSRSYEFGTSWRLLD